MALPSPSKTMQTSDLLNYYLTMNMNNICRVCLEKSCKLTHIFDAVKPPHFSVLLMACAAVQVQEGDGLPPYICQKCISRVNIAFQFKTQCESSDIKLRQCLETYNLQEASAFSGGNVDETIDEPHYEGALEGQHQENDDSIMETEPCIIIKQEDFKPAEVKKGKRPLKPTQGNTCETCGKVFKTKPSLVHHIRIHTGERPYVCHLCPKRFVNGGHLHTHMKTHTGEKNHVCAACNKGFATAQQLTKHTIAIHTSERPYGCTYCPKRFASSSNLNTHIKIHTGEKNFHCEVCGKTFSTKGQLQQHLLVHTGEKAFLCEYCNKRFSQKAHLIRHLRIHNRTE